MRFSIRLALLTTACISMIACEKTGDDDTTNPKTNITRQTLMGNSGKRWLLASITLTYSSASGSVDSTVEKKSNASNYLNQSIFFGDNLGVNGIGQNFTTEGYLSEIMPPMGSWSVNESSQTLSLVCMANRFFPCNNTDGQWTFTGYVSLPQSGNESLFMERTVALPGNRKVKQKVHISIS